MKFKSFSSSLNSPLSSEFCFHPVHVHALKMGNLKTSQLKFWNSTFFLPKIKPPFVSWVWIRAELWARWRVMCSLTAVRTQVLSNSDENKSLAPWIFELNLSQCFESAKFDWFCADLNVLWWSQKQFSTTRTIKVLYMFLYVEVFTRKKPKHKWWTSKSL